MAANDTSRCFHRFGLFTHFTLFILAVSLSNVYSADVNGDLVFDDVTSNPSSQFRPLNWRKHVNKNVNHIVTEEVPDISDESNYFSPVRFVGTLKGSFERVKRGLFDIGWPFVGGSNDKTDSETKTTVQSTVNSDEISSSTSSKETTEEQTESLLIGNTLTTLIREARSTNSDSNDFPLGDDEDMDENSGTPSGDTKFPGNAGFPGTNFDHPSHPYLFRIILTIKEPYFTEYDDRNSKKYQELSQSLSSAIEDLYQDLPGRKMARLVGIQKKEDDRFESIVMIDLEFIGYYDADEIQERLKRHISEYSKLGNIPVSDKDIKIKDFGAAKKCLPGEIDCNTENGPSCLPAEARCNGIPECTDGIDESNCPRVTPDLTTDFKAPDVNTSDHVYVPFETSTVGTTASGRGTKLCRSDEQVRCADGVTLICDVQKCDDHVDCPQGDDEENCPKSSVCASTEFVCDITRCIPQTSVCDKKRDCTDDTDEHEDCEYNKGILRSHVCPEGQFMCSSGHCISVMTRCDQKVDCPEDETDEEGCPCTKSQWQCNDGTCISDFLRCNGVVDCPTDTSDELNCQRSSVQQCDRKTQFQCSSGECIDRKQKCDSVNDCRDHSDESNCWFFCGANKFQCQNGYCIPLALRCDGMYHCNDRSDEQNCFVQVVNCTTDQFQCNDGTCVARDSVCDRHYHCPDGSDEFGCDDMGLGPCHSSEFSCSDGSCIPMYKYCDGFKNCPSGIDEEDCSDAFPQTCGPRDFTCADGQCIDNYKRCNRIPDCRDRSDEDNCPCYDDEFRCRDGSCIPEANRCNGRSYDCRDNSDEENCYRACSSDEFRCHSGECISSSKVCDYTPDCRDRSDELNCTQQRTCSWTQFACHSRTQCVPKHKHCDGTYDCSDRSDEFNCAPNPIEELHLKTYPEDQLIKEGREVVFQCRDEGPLRAAVRWSRGNGLPLPPGSRDNNGRLEMPNIQLSHAGTYVCEALSFSSSSPGARVSVHLSVEPYTQPLPPTRPPLACGLNEATCSNGECISKSLVCNGHYDCTDGSDEMRCNPHGCEPNQFTCDNRRCVQKTWRCDSDDDCGDGSDERNCGTSPPGARCRTNEFECSSLNQCIPKAFHCDMEPDCQDGSDEISCSRVFPKVPPEPMKVLNQGATFFMSCEMTGVPTPEIIWRRNWGHIPPKCVVTSENGYGTITCPDVQDSDQGAYSCEGMNSRGSTLATPDTILVVSPPNGTSVCPPGQFNDLARIPSECITCFCFGTTSECRSANLFTYQLPAPADRFQLVDVHFPTNGEIEVRRNQPSSLQPALRARSRSFQLLSETSASRTYEQLYPYFSLPENNYHGNHLKSYGGFLNYTVSFSGIGQPLNHPDVILIGNGQTLIHKGSRLAMNRDNQRSVQFFVGDWYRSLPGISGGEDSVTSQRQETLATRGDIMMALEDVENILINVQYLTGPGIETSISNVHVDSAAVPNSGQGQAALVEQCSCPAGYMGLSCEECSPGFVRESSGSWLGRCTKHEECDPGYYGDPGRGIPCKPCPCPLTNPSNQFGRTCYLGTDGDVVCNCPEGYTDRRCSTCDEGYTGNPLIPGDYCKKNLCNAVGSVSTLPDPSTGQCRCKEHVTGPFCDTCKENTFHLSTRYHKGCVSCFCMGITKECRSLNWYRNQITAAFTRTTQDFKLAEISDLGEPITDGLFVQPQTRELVYEQFNRPDVYYWVLPHKFLGDRIDSYGGYLNYTLRYVPTPGGQSSRNNAPDVELISNNNIRLRYFNNDNPIEPNRPATITVPMVESKWQREDGQTADRENFLMALADLNAILIKATYTTNTQSAALITVSLDYADERNTFQTRTTEVEQCTCPPGYRGLSCQECDIGYTRTDTGLYLGICEPCNCNGHSSICDPNTGKCTNCEGHTTGDSCELCEPGYSGNPGRGEPCTVDGEDKRLCYCDERGSFSTECRNNQCSCKTNVEGPRCDRCRSGCFDLSASHPEGCLECFCSSVTDVCQPSNLYLTQIPMQIIDQSHGFTLTDSNRNEVIRDGFHLNVAQNEIGYDFRNQHSRRLFWSLPPNFTGDKVTSYGGNLTFTQLYSSLQGGSPAHDTDVVIVGNGISIYWTSEEELQPDRPTTRVIPLVASKWRRLDPLFGQRTASRVDILTVLSAVEAILIRATFSTHTSSTFLSDVSLDTAVPQRTGQSVATHVELCRCPPGYRGTSCELCSPGYYRDTNHRCHQCPCNGNEESCALGSDSRVVCHCKPSFVGPYCDSLGSVTTDGPSTSSPIAPPSISISISDPTATIVGRTVRVRCSARALLPGRSVSLTWSKDKGELPRGRAEDDGQGNLAISDVNLSDSGYYICTANDGYSYVTERVLVLVKDHSVALPQVSVHPKSQEVTEGEPVRFECNAKGIPTPTLQWVDVQRNQLNPQSSFVDGVFYIPSVRSTDQSTYQCIATNSEGTRAETVVLYVRELSTASPIGNNLTVEPQEAIGSPGEIIRIRCSPPSPDYVVSWSRTSNQPLQPTATNEDGILTIYDASPSDSGLYICSAKTSSGYHLDAYGRITVQSYRLPPSVRIEPESQTVMQGMVAELRCAATGEPAPIVRWSKLQENLPDNIQVTGNILKILNARVADRGVYICQAENAGGTAQGAAKVEVEPREAPQVELYPHSLQTVTEGNSVMFQCIIKAGIPNPTLRWSKANDLALPQNAELLNGGVLRLTSVSVADKGQYICSVENDVGKASAIATIEVHTLPRIQVTPRGPIITVTPGQKLRLDCRATGYPEPSVSWEKYQPSSNIYGFDPVQSPSSRTGAVFEIFSVTENDEGIYICKANNPAGPAEEHIQVVLSNSLDPGPTRGDIPGGADYDDGNHPQPVGHLEIDNTLFRIPAGGNGQIQCRVTANPNVLQLKWERNGNSTLPSDFYHRDGILYINNVQRHDAGVYSCLGISHSGSILFTADARVQVVEIPRITLDPVKQTVRLGDNAQVICHVHGDPPIEVSWAAVNRALPPSATARDGYLTFHNIAESDAGKYICRARNSYGNVEAVAEVIINEHVHNNYRPVITAADRSPVAIEGSSISLKCNSEPHIRIYWTRDRYPLPSNARPTGNDLKLDSLRQEDSGRYICHAESASGITSSDYIDLRVTQPQLCSGSEFHCRSGECIPRAAVCDQRLHCRDGSDESYCTHRPLRGANNVTLRIEPSQDVVRIGDNVELRCVSYGAPTQVYWSKVGDVQTTNIQVPSSDVVRIVGAELNNRGLYRCSSQTPTGVVDEDYILNIQPSLPHVDAATVETKTAANGQSVIMDCNVKMPPPVKYVWSKQEGELPARASVNQGTLSIPEVTAAEAGMYICTATNDDGRMDIPTILVVTGSVPFFSQAPVSYIAVPTLHNAYLDFDIELSFKPEQPDGLILYNSQQNDGSGDFVSLGLKNGVLEFRFDVGSGIAVIRASHPISVGQWHTVQLHRDRREGKMYVDGNGPFSGYSSGNFQGLDLLEPMFLGGFPDFSHIHKLAGFSSGFVGCISKLVVGKREIDLIKDAVRREGITHCETCAVNPCDNNGVCQESPTQLGYRCICPRGFSGENCTQVGEPCFPGVCGTGRCSSSERGMDCYCPIYKGGKRCERSISEYAFSGNAYLAYPTPKAVHKLKVALKFNPASTADSILLYCAQNEYGQGDFTSLSIKDQYIEFRFDTGTGPTILRSKQQIYPGQWVTVSAVRDHREGSHHVLSKLIVNGHQPVIENASGKSHGSNLNLRTPLYIGGYDKLVKLASGVGVKDSFKGCISEVEVSGLESDYIRSVVETFNVEECSELHKDACQLQPCQNDGNCIPSSNPPRYSCMCKVGFSGEHCEIEDDMCKLLNPCRNNAKCTGTSSSYKCLCPIGFSGATCGDRVEFNTEVSFQGDGFIELSKDMLTHTNPEEEEIVTIEFSTENLNGILFWHGQNPDTDGVDQDYLSLAVAGGFLEMSWELGGGPAVIRSHGRVNDGRKHTVVMKRTAKDGSLKVDDDMNVFGETSGLLTHLNSNGNIYLGGLPNIEKMTGRKYSEGLNGCIHFIQIQDSGVINLWEKAVSAQNALPCSSTDHFSLYDDDENSIHPNRGDLIN